MPGRAERKQDVKEARIIATNEPRKIKRTAAASASSAPAKKAADGKGAHSATPTKKARTQKPKKQPKPKKKGGFWLGLLKFVFVCCCLGAMAVSAVAVVMVNYVVEATANDNLDLDRLSQSQSSTVLAYDSTTEQWFETATLKSANSHRLQADLEEIPEALQWAFICTEDKNFYNEPGVNIKRTIGAMINEYTPIKLYSSKQGASTLEQQLIKNILDDKASSGLDGALRKVREIFRAYGLYKNFSKQTILECYLNTISFTGTIQGVKTAAMEYFGKDISDLNLQECAVIASITKNPTENHPYKNPENLLERRNYVLWNMYDQGKITEAEYRAAADSPLILVEENSKVVNPNASEVSSYFDDALYEQLVTDFMEQYDWTREQASNYIYTGGLTVYSPMDPKLQASLEAVMMNPNDKYFPAGWTEEEVKSIGANDIQVFNEDGTPKTKTKTEKVDGVETEVTYYYRKVRTQAAMATVDYEGRVLALVGGIGEKTSSRSLNRAYDVARQTGSSIKPLTCYGLAVEYGLYNWSSLVMDTPLYTAEQQIIKNENGNGYRDWPKNYGNSYSYEMKHLWDGLSQSLNTIAAQVGDTVGANAMYSFARNTLQLDHFVESDENLGALCMGSQSYGATPVEMAAAFQIFNTGTFTTPHLYTEVYDSDGNLVLEADTTSYQALTEATATVMNRMLNMVTRSGTAGRLGGSVAGHPTIGKTGTASDERDLWFVGATPYYVTSVWWGYDEPKDMRKTVGRDKAKTSTCVDAWKAYMADIHADLEVKKFPVSDDVVTRSYCVNSGLLASGSCVETAQGYYKKDALPDVCDYGY